MFRLVAMRCVIAALTFAAPPPAGAALGDPITRNSGLMENG